MLHSLDLSHRKHQISPQISDHHCEKEIYLSLWYSFTDKETEHASCLEKVAFLEHFDENAKQKGDFKIFTKRNTLPGLANML